MIKHISTVAVAAALTLLIWSGLAQAQKGQPAVYPRTLVAGDEAVVALDGACTWPEFNNALKPEFKNKAKNGFYVARGKKPIAGCYVELDGHLVFAFTDGDIMAFHENEFVRRPLPTGKETAI